jgi:GntR family transcriptional regulator
MPKQKQENSSMPQTENVETVSQFQPLDKSSFTPLYFQIQDQLLKMITSGKLRPGDLLPSEEDLSRTYGVSRMTSRQALQALKSHGYASRYKGKGTFVTQPKVEKDLTHLSGFSAEMRLLGLSATSRVLAADTKPATADIAARLAVEPGAAIFRLLRLRLADAVPIAIEEIFLPLERYPGIEALDFARLSLYATLRERYGIRLSLADEILEARAATRQEAELLEIAPRASLLVISRTLWSVEGKPVEAARSAYRGDRYRAVLQIPATVVE